MGSTPTPSKWSKDQVQTAMSARVDDNKHLHHIAFALLANVGVADSLSLSLLYGELSLPEAPFKELRQKHPDNHDFLKMILARWISLKSYAATYAALSTALKAIGLNDGANILENLLMTKFVPFVQ